MEFNSSEEDYSNFYALFEQLDNSIDQPDNKKRRTSEEGNQSSNFKDILSTLLLLEDEEKANQRRQEEAQAKERSSFIQFNSRQKMEEMNEYYAQFNDHYDAGMEFDQLRVKRARQESAGVVVSAVSEGVGASQSNRNGSGGQQRRLWVKDRSTAWWDLCNSPDFPDEEFKKAFRMSKSTFDMICAELDSAVTKKDTMLRLAIPVRQRVAVCIWRLATGDPLRLVSKRFGLGISTCHKLVLEVCGALHSVLMPKFLNWPNENRLKEIKSEYEAISGIPNVGGSMYTTHIPIIAPKISVASYFNKRHTERNQKTSYSITVQGVVDPKGVFTDVCIGWPGSMSDDKVLEKSALHQRANKGLLKDVWIVGNAGYPLMDWVLVPYSHQNLTWAQHSFNVKIDEHQRIAKEAFMKLKARWTCLQKRTEVKLQELPVVLGACCVLHNICEMNNESLDSELKFELFDDPMVAENGVRSVSAMQTRDHIAHNLLHHNFGGSTFL